MDETLIQLSQPIIQSLTTSNLPLPLLESLLPPTKPTTDLTNFTLLCAALSASQTSSYDQLSLVPLTLSISANSAFQQLRKAFYKYESKELLVELLPTVLPLVKSSIKEDTDADRAPVSYAIVSAYQFNWLVTQINLELLEKLCMLIIPCALTAIDHWSPEVKGQGMMVVIHLAKHVSCSEFSLYGDVMLDACCQNIASSDEIWEYVVEMSVLLVTCTQQNNPRSSWFEKLLNEMLSHLWRQPRSKERRIAWLRHIKPLFSCMGLVLLGHFRRLFPLFFKWMHADDDATVLLVLDSIKTVIKFTWIRYSPYYDKLVDELVILYKDASLKVERDDIRARILEILILLQQCKGQQFEAAWIKHKHDPNLATLCPSLTSCSS